MTRTHQTLILGGLFLVGLLGCTGNDRAAQLESRVAKLDDELKTAITSRDALKARLGLMEEMARAETERRQLVEKEREELSARLRQKVVEKDAVVGNYDELVKQLEGLLGQAKVMQTQQADVAAGKVPATQASFPKK